MAVIREGYIMRANSIKSYLVLFLTGAIASLALTDSAQAQRRFGSPRSNQPLITDTEPSSPEPPRTTSEANGNPNDIELTPDHPNPQEPSLDQPSLTVTVYRPDLFCENLIPRTEQVSPEQPTEGAIGHVLKDWAQGEFRLAGYRVQRDDLTGVVNVDLRIAPDAPRRWSSLSTCEQFSLLGSLRSTLLENPELDIVGVEFSSQGRPLVF
jgi:hypothetical protein